VSPEESQEAMKTIRGWSKSPMRKGCKSWGSSAWRSLQGDFIVAFHYLKGAYKTDVEGLFTRACSDRASVKRDKSSTLSY